MSDSTKDSSGEAQDLRQRISASQERSRSRRKSAAEADGRPVPPDPRGTFERAVEDHPLAMLAGSAILGIVAANLLQRSLGRKIASRVMGIAAVVGELGASYGNKTLEAAAEASRASQERLSKLGEAVAEESAEVRRRAAEMGAQARRKAAELASEAAAEAREAGESAVKRIGKLGGR
jgi:hypothetical protein